MPLTHGERAERRGRMASAVAGGATTREVAVEFGVTSETVVKACATAGVLTDGRRGKPLPNRTYLLIGALCTSPGRTMADLAAEFGVSVQWVSQVYRLCVGAGIPVTPRTPGRHSGGGAAGSIS